VKYFEDDWSLECCTMLSCRDKRNFRVAHCFYPQCVQMLEAVKQSLHTYGGAGGEEI
jgi:hypothetical protein